MSLPVMPNPRVQFFNGSTPLSGGKVYTYDANTSTPKATYTSAAGTTLNANPVILDSRGEASIYLSGSYKIILKDTDDVQIWSEPDISIMPYQAITQSEWIAQDLTFTYSSATVFTTTGDQTSIFQVGRRIQATVSAGTVYGVIKTSAYTTLTTVTVVLDSGSLDSGLSAVWVGLITTTNTSLPGLYAIPRLTTTQRDALTAVNGMVIYNTTTSRYQWYNGSWLDIVDTNSTDTLAGKTLTTPTLTTPKILTGGSIQDGGGDEFLEFVEATTPVNHMRLENANTGTGPKFSAQGTDANIDLQIEAKGTGTIKLNSPVFGGVTPADNSVTQAKIADAAVGQAELKTAIGTVSVSNGALTDLTLPGGEYGFYPQVKAAPTMHSTNVEAKIANSGTNTSYVTNIALRVINWVDGTDYSSAQQRYFQASPPYMIGNTLWGHFLFLLRDIATGTVRAAYEAEDPPWAYNGAIYLPKDDPGRLAEVPHPFADYWQKDPAIDGLEIVMVDLSTHDTKKWKGDNAKLGKGILEDLGAVVKGKGTLKAHTDYLLPEIPRFTDRIKIITP